ncbi:IS110 family transposase, partial [Candidatus Bipolaricaulota bacterium]|nr:IS110 family transposase [Candidatus Bipolaricaulota bacterium]
GTRVEELSFSNHHSGYEQFLDKLGNLEEKGITVTLGAEGHAGNLSPLDQYLNEENFQFVSIHPLKVRRYKDILGQPQKTDNYDAYVIADFLRSREDQLKNRPRFDPTIQEVKKLSRTYKDLEEQLNRYTNQLDEVLTEYFPEFLNDDFPDLTTKTALRLLNEYSSLTEIEELDVDELSDFLRSASRGHYGENLASRLLETIGSIKRSPLAEEAYRLKIKTLTDLLLRVKKHSKEIKKRVSRLLEGWEDAQIVLSLDGAGDTLVGRFLGEVETIDRFDGSDPLGLYCGASPLPYSSGKYSTDRTPQRVNKRAKDAIMQIARCSVLHNPESKRYYDKKRDEGKSHWHAIKCLARQLIRVIYAMLRDRTYYQPNKNENHNEEQKKEVVAVPA